MKIICWNMQHKKASWRFLHERHADADVALLQEACTPPSEIKSKLDVGPGPWIYKGWNGARAVVGLSGRVKLERVPVSDIMASAAPNSVIKSPARLALAIATLPGGRADSTGLPRIRRQSHRPSAGNDEAGPGLLRG